MSTASPLRLTPPDPSSAPAESPKVVRGLRDRAAVLLTTATLVLSFAAAVAGLAVDGGYGEPAATASMLRGYDLVTLVVVVPALAVALLGRWRGSAIARLVWAGLLAATAYTYAYHLFGTALNDLFLLHVAVFSTALFALVLAVSALDVPGLARHWRPRTPVRWIAGLLGVLAVGLGGMWILAALSFAVTGDPPEGSALVETPAVVHLGLALDLSLLVPGYALAAVLLWRRAPWGYVLAALLLISGTVHQLGYLVALGFQRAAGVPGAVAMDPLEPPIALAFLLATAALLAGGRAAARPHSPTG